MWAISKSTDKIMKMLKQRISYETDITMFAEINESYNTTPALAKCGKP